ncbi:MAG: hypothetical protein ABI604_14730, partial [Nitrospirota bacterium]
CGTCFRCDSSRCCGAITVGRASMGFLDESTAGIIFTNGNPLQNAENHLSGADLTLKSSNFLGTSQVVELDA